MPTKSINRSISILPGDIEIYVDKGQQQKAMRLIRKMPHILTEAHKVGSRNFGRKLLRMVKRCLSTGTPPPGSGVSWPPHAASTVKSLGEHLLLNWTGQYQRTVQIVETRKRVYVGIPPAVRKIRKNGPGRKTLNQIAITLEYGSRSGLIPPRPLWNPAFTSVGGKEMLRKEIRNEIRKQLRKYT